jgi:DNA polymerase-1
MIADSINDLLDFDLETDGLLKELTRIWVLAIGNARTGEITTYTDHDPNHPPLAQGVARLMAHVERNTEGGKTRRCLVAHNGINFDRKAFLKVTGKNIPATAIWDTMVLGRLREPQRANHKLESYGVELGILKGEYSGGWDAYSEDMRAYNHQDIVVTQALFKHVKEVLSWGESAELEHQVAYLIDLQMENGFPLDVRAGLDLAARYNEERQALIAELQRVFPPIYVSDGSKHPKRDTNFKATDKRPAWGTVKDAPWTAIKLQEFNPDSDHHIAARLKRRYGWIATTAESGYPDVCEKVLKKLDFPEAKLLLRFARVNKQWTQLASPPKIDKNGKRSGGGWLHHTDDNDRVHGYVNSNGAVTGRMTHRMPNSANIDKEPELRALWVPGSGFVMVGCDAEGLELRVLAHYLTPYDGGKLTFQLLEGDKSNGTDAHSMNAKNTDVDRDTAKTLLYAAMYGAGGENLGGVWLSYWRSTGKPESEWPRWAFTKAGKLRPVNAIGNDVKKRLVSGIKGFKELIEAISAAAKKRGWVRGIDGRHIKVLYAHAALNSLLQGTGAVIMKKALAIYHHEVTEDHALVHGVDFGYLANVHDEVQQEVLPKHAELCGRTFKEAITKAGDHFKFRCRLDGAYDIGKNWHETH